jgi:hypothetical protein
MEFIIKTFFKLFVATEEGATDFWGVLKKAVKLTLRFKDCLSG